MSGGPTLTQAGRVAGINVATEGEQISYLVPAKRAQALLEKNRSAQSRPAGSFLAEVGRQIHAYQADYLAGMFAASKPSVILGPYSCRANQRPSFVWADAFAQERLMCRTHDCSTDDYLFVSTQAILGHRAFLHQLLSTDALDPLRFYSSIGASPGGQSRYGRKRGGGHTFSLLYENVKNHTESQGRFVRAPVCQTARTIRRRPQAATLGSRNAGLVSTLSLSGVVMTTSRPSRAAT